MGNTMSWTGRQLDSITKADNTAISYGYNADGIRVSKTVDGVTTEYFVSGSTILAEKTGDDVIWYIYDGGEIVGFIYNGTSSYYVNNLQGDVMYVVNAFGLPMAAYTYDAWGNVTSAQGTLAQVNPIRYRGYYYDDETGFYYLNSRYYDPEVGRFINADSIAFLGASGSLQGYNLFAYCNNNPVNNSDPSGCMTRSEALAWQRANLNGGMANFGAICEKLPI